MVVNLKPAKLFGVESQGMLLAAEADGQLRLLTLDGELPAGAHVS
jgi:methionyl-tRNA synthetase